MVAVEVGRKQTRKVCNNVRGVIGLGCILSPPTYIKAHYCVTALLVTVRGLLKLQDASVFLYKILCTVGRVFMRWIANPV